MSESLATSAVSTVAPGSPPGGRALVTRRDASRAADPGADRSVNPAARAAAEVTGESAADPDDLLMAEVRAGSREAFAELVDRHKDRLVGYLGRLTGSWDRAEDLAQEAFLRLYQSAGRYDERGRLQALLFSIATNLLRSEERRKRRWRLLAPFLAEPSPAHGVPAAAESAHARVLRRELGRELQAALAALPLRYRVPLVLYEIEEWTYDEIGRHLGCRPGTVKSRIHRGRQRLRERLAPHWTPNEVTSDA